MTDAADKIRQMARDLSCLSLRDARSLFTAIYTSDAIVRHGSKTAAAKALGIQREQLSRIRNRHEAPND